MRRMVMTHPSAWLPLLMSLAALTLVLVHLARFGVTYESDEGTAAHLFQLLMAGQVPVVAFFALKWIPRAPSQALQVLAMQAIAGFSAFGALFILERGLY